MKRFIPFKLAFLLCLLPAAALSQTKAVYCQPEDSLIFHQYIHYMAGHDSLPYDSLVVRTALYFLGKPYVASTLEHEPECLVVNLRQFDCTTFVESVLALTRTFAEGDTSFTAYCDNLRFLRYRDGIIRNYTDRLHYSSDWFYENNRKGIVRYQGKSHGLYPYHFKLNFMSKHPDNYRQLKSDSDFVAAMRIVEKRISARDSFYYYIPAGGIDSIATRIPSGDMLGFVTTVKGLDIGHLGITYRRNGVLTFINASSKSMKVEVYKGSLSQYVKERPHCPGIMLARPLPRQPLPSGKN
ncbi:MAG: DUF1460 domain-containing protein [Tannerella sp.]|jgi:hypothetical protein|nr:DUF1460 domain-containing protein [Tannerella sp.]